MCHSLALFALLAAQPTRPAPPPPPPPPPPELPAPPTPDAPVVHVTLLAQDETVRLGRIPTKSKGASIARYTWLGERPEWECSAPCNKLVGRADDAFVVFGDGISDSPSFSISGARRVVIEARSGYRELKPVGVLSLVFGGIGLTVGGLVTGLNAAQPPGYRESLNGGIAALVSGLVLIAGGMTSIYFSWTKAQVSPLPDLK